MGIGLTRDEEEEGMTTTDDTKNYADDFSKANKLEVLEKLWAENVVLKKRLEAIRELAYRKRKYEFEEIRELKNMLDMEISTGNRGKG